MKVLTGLLIVVSLMFFSGCNPENIQPAGGKVLVDGKPVTDGSIMFYPVDGGRPGSGTILADGTFVISYLKPGDGLPPGEYKVAIEANTFQRTGLAANVDESGMEVGVPRGKVTYVVPEIYNAIEDTPLRQIVSEGVKQDFIFDIPSKLK